MNDDKDDLPSDAEKGGLKPQTPKEDEPPSSTADKKKEEQDPSEQPS